MPKITIQELNDIVEAVEGRLERQGNKIDTMEQRITKEIGGLGNQLGNYIQVQVQAQAKMMEKLDGIKTGIENLDCRLKVVEEDVEKLKKDKVENRGVPMKEFMEIEDKKANLVIFGIPEQTGTGLSSRSAKDKDAQVVDSILEEVARRKIVFEVKFRIGQKEEGKVRPIVLKLCNQHEKYEILDNCTRLKDLSQWQNVYIRPDLTKLQRDCRQAHEAQLKAEASQRNAELKNGETWEWKLRGLRHLAKVHNTNH